MKKLVQTLVLAGCMAAPVAAMAEDSPHTFSGNVSMTSNYVFRGISQTGGDAALQGGFDYTHSSGFYLGTWGSNVGWIEDYQGYGSGNVEFDLYGGFRGGIGETGVTFDVGAIGYFYPGEKAGGLVVNPVNADTREIYAALGWKWFTVKYSYYISDGVFGFGNADGSDYIDVAASLPIGETGLTAGAHWGTFSFDNNGAQDYDDWKVSLAYDMGKLGGKLSGVTLGVMYTDTNADRAVWTDFNGEYLGKGTATVWISKAL